MHTRCPHCSTTFSISQQHLEVAGGQVRCGSCDQVFDGRDNVVDAQGNYIRKRKEEKTSDFETGADIFGMIEEASAEFEPEPDPEPVQKVRKTKQIDESWADALLSDEGFDDTPEPNTPPPVMGKTVSKNRNSQSIVSEPVSAPIKKKPTMKPARQLKAEPPKPSRPRSPQTKSLQPKPSLPRSSANESQLSDEFLDLSGFDNINNPFRDSDTPIHESAHQAQNKSAVSSSKERRQNLEEELRELEGLKGLQTDGKPPLDSSNKKSINKTTQQRVPSTQSNSAITQAKKRKTRQQKELQKNKDTSFDQELLAELNEFHKHPSEQNLSSKDKRSLDEKNIQEDFEHWNKNDKSAKNKVPKKNKSSVDLNNSSLISDLKEIADDLGSEATNEHAFTKDELGKPKTGHLFALNFDTSEILPDKQLKPGLKQNRIIYSISILFTSLLLGFQFTFFNMDQFARDPKYRPYYHKACEALPCSLPTLQNLNKIRGSHLVVRQHPDDDKALLVDIIMTNTANYPQLFPIMEIIFTDGEHLPVKQRQLKPKEYLKGDLTKLSAMPAGKPIHVSLEIVDPGRKAKGWEINFLAFLN